jgi:hypothetical protein
VIDKPIVFECINDRPIRIDVASRPLGATKSEAFRNKPTFESRNGPRQPSGHNNNRGLPQNGRGGNQHRGPQKIDAGYYENGFTNDYFNKINLNDHKDSRQNSDRQSQTQKEQTSPSSRKVSDDVFFASDTPALTEDENHEQEDTTTMIRQQSRNWADCPIDDSVVDTSPPPLNINNALTADDSDDFQIVRNKTTKSRPKVWLPQ